MTVATTDLRLVSRSTTGIQVSDDDGRVQPDRPVTFAALVNRPNLPKAGFRLRGLSPLAPHPTIAVGPKLGLTIVPAVGDAPTVAWHWLTAATDAVSASSVKLDQRAGPTIAARFYAMLGTALYEAWQVFDRRARSTLPEPTGAAPWDQVLEQQVDGFLQAIENTDDKSSLATGLIHNVVARTAHAVLSSPLSGIQDGSTGLIRLHQQLQDSLRSVPSAHAAFFNGLDQRISEAVAANVLESFRNDGSSLTLPSLTNPLTSSAPAYAPLNSGPSTVERIDRWTPEFSIHSDASTPLQSFLTPFWGNVQYYLLRRDTTAALPSKAKKPEPFLLDPRDSYDLKLGLIFDDGRGPGLPITPAQIGRTINPRFVHQADEVVAYSRALASPEGARFKGIAQFWENGAGTAFPPGTWMQFGQYASLLHDNILADDVKLFLGLGASAYAASIASWQLKRQEDYARPLRVVRELSRFGLMKDRDQNPANGSQFTAYVRGEGLRDISGVDWETYQTAGSYSPPFPEFVSGHSTFSAAAADFLTNFYNSAEFGGKVEFGLSLGDDPAAQQVSLGWDTWKGAAQEAGFSRLWGGIHFLDGNLEGQALGSSMGARTYHQLSHLWA